MSATSIEAQAYEQQKNQNALLEAIRSEIQRNAKLPEGQAPWNEIGREVPYAYIIEKNEATEAVKEAAFASLVDVRGDLGKKEFLDNCENAKETMRAIAMELGEANIASYKDKKRFQLEQEYGLNEDQIGLLNKYFYLERVLAKADRLSQFAQTAIEKSASPDFRPLADNPSLFFNTRESIFDFMQQGNPIEDSSSFPNISLKRLPNDNQHVLLICTCSTFEKTPGFPVELMQGSTNFGSFAYNRLDRGKYSGDSSNSLESQGQKQQWKTVQERFFAAVGMTREQVERKVTHEYISEILGGIIFNDSQLKFLKVFAELRNIQLKIDDMSVSDRLTLTGSCVKEIMDHTVSPEAVFGSDLPIVLNELSQAKKTYDFETKVALPLQIGTGGSLTLNLNLSKIPIQEVRHTPEGLTAVIDLDNVLYTVLSYKIVPQIDTNTTHAGLLELRKKGEEVLSELKLPSSAEIRSVFSPNY